MYATPAGVRIRYYARLERTGTGRGPLSRRAEPDAVRGQVRRETRSLKPDTTYANDGAGNRPGLPVVEHFLREESGTHQAGF